MQVLKHIEGVTSKGRMGHVVAVRKEPTTQTPTRVSFFPFSHQVCVCARACACRTDRIHETR